MTGMRPAVADATFEVEITGASDLWRGHQQHLTKALIHAASMEGVSGVVSVLLGDDERIAVLNHDFRGKHGPTNVLSFPAAPLEDGPAGFLGDIALAAETIDREARAQGKSFDAHADHLAVHGFLHLLGYDHESPGDAEEMEARERAILAELGIADPYA